MNDDLVWLLTWAKSLVAFATITIPTWLYAVLSYSMTLTVSPLRLEAISGPDSAAARLLEPRRIVHRSGHWRELRDKVPIPQ